MKKNIIFRKFNNEISDYRESLKDKNLSAHIVIPCLVISISAMIFLIFEDDVLPVLSNKDYIVNQNFNIFIIRSLIISSTFLVVEYTRDWVIKFFEQEHDVQDAQKVSIVYIFLYILFLSYSEIVDSEIGLIVGITMGLVVSLAKITNWSDDVLFGNIADLSYISFSLLYLFVFWVILFDSLVIIDYFILYVIVFSLPLGFISYYENWLIMVKNKCLSPLFQIYNILIKLYNNL
jgi:hypothetical protein